MKNLFKFGFLAFALSLSVAACNSEKSGEGTDTATTDSGTTVVDTNVTDTTVTDTTVTKTTTDTVAKH
ncbi:hypothetical protein C7T94_09700 [Pedobacter yulinensis]|uniref:Entericidin n=1 Tax=Pedobacter yulinensis TaxID=2126353 RepID=A0A2T3HKF4_9SPHI|nr:hypothetical protein [Pedobacter yulinensis]PST82899.1 hypothetical protein C7T94_09700 [Pedobacter yulinensis]